MSIRLGSENYMAKIDRIMTQGTGADFLRKRFRETGDLQVVVQSLQREFWQ